jgi:hypothetical protein
MTLIRRDEYRATRASLEFWNGAKLHLPYVLKDHGHQRLRAFLLLTHYSFLNPKAANLWLCSGAALSMALEMGLHSEPTVLHQGGVIMTDSEERRKLFWATYILNGSVTRARMRLS